MASSFGKLMGVEKALEVGTDSASEEPHNPFCNQLILNKVFRLCELKDLGSCRRVSKLWYLESLPHWRRKGPQIRLPLHSAYGRGGTCLPSFLRTVHNEFHSYNSYEYAGLRQYRKFQLSGDLSCDINHNLLQRFLRNCGEWITELKLDMKISDLDTYKALMFSRMTPNLIKLDADITIAEKVNLDDCDSDPSEEGHSKLTSLQIHSGFKGLSALGWGKLLGRYPNLQTLVYGGIRSLAKAVDVERMLEAIYGRRRDEKKLLDLKHLEIYCKSDLSLTPVSSLFRDTYMSLQTFCICVGTRITHHTVYEVLESQASSLRKLILKGDGSLSNFQPPRMDSVENLELCGFQFQNLTFLKSFPNLRTLTFVFDCSTGGQPHIFLSGIKEEDLEGLIIPTLATFHCRHAIDSPHNIILPTPQDIRKLHGCMPNLKNLQMWLQDSMSIREVYKCWPLLQELCIARPNEKYFAETSDSDIDYDYFNDMCDNNDSDDPDGVRNIFEH